MEQAKGVVPEEAGVMLVADGLMVWNIGCRPCISAPAPAHRHVPESALQREAKQHVLCDGAGSRTGAANARRGTVSCPERSAPNHQWMY